MERPACNVCNNIVCDHEQPQFLRMGAMRQTIGLFSANDTATSVAIEAEKTRSGWVNMFQTGAEVGAAVLGARPKL